MYNIAICDDNPVDRERFQNLLINNEKCPNDINIYEFQSGEELLKGMKIQNFSLIFLDIELGGMDGNKTASEIRNIDLKVILVFMTAYVQPTSLSFEVQPYRYLMKQVPDIQLHKNISDILKKMIYNASYPILIARTQSMNLRFGVDDIICIEKYTKKCRLYIIPQTIDNYGIHDNADKIFYDGKLDQIYNEIKCYGFGYPHDSYVINFNYITAASRKSFRLYGIDKIFHISRSKSQEFNNEKNAYLLSKYKKY